MKQEAVEALTEIMDALGVVLEDPVFRVRREQPAAAEDQGHENGEDAHDDLGADLRLEARRPSAGPRAAGRRPSLVTGPFLALEELLGGRLRPSRRAGAADAGDALFLASHAGGRASFLPSHRRSLVVPMRGEASVLLAVRTPGRVLKKAFDRPRRHRDTELDWPLHRRNGSVALCLCGQKGFFSNLLGASTGGSARTRPACPPGRAVRRSRGPGR